MSGYDWERVEEELRALLIPKRFSHTLGVTYTACALAMCHGAPLEQARIAGLLHDCAKCLTDVEKVDLACRDGSKVSNLELTHPGLLHARAGAVLARERFGVDDPEVLTAIRQHTTGAVAMNLLSEIIYVADYIEPHRHKAPNLPRLRALAFRDLKCCVCEILQQTVDHLLEVSADGAATDPMTEQAWQYYRSLF